MPQETYFIDTSRRKMSSNNLSQPSYSTVEDHRRVYDYEDPDYTYYEKPPELPNRNRHSYNPKSHSISPLSLPTQLSQSTLQRLHYSDPHRKREPCCSRQKMLGFGFLVFVLLVASSIAVLLWHVQNNNHIRAEMFHKQENNMVLKQNGGTVAVPNKTVNNDYIISPNYLVTLLITKRKICLFEVSTSEEEQSKTDFEQDHIQSAQLLFFSNLSHTGVPVHPLQFQRFIRKYGVDTDCHIVLYDRGQLIWSTYAFWIFKLFRHEKVSLLNGGLTEWKLLSNKPSTLYKLEQGRSSSPSNVGDFKAWWNSDVITTFDDVITNFDKPTHNIVDAQNADEFEGKVEGFGHMRSAVNVLIEDVYDWSNNTWPSIEYQRQFFESKKLNLQKPVFVYDGTSLRSTMVWFALKRLNYEAAIYFGSWPEFVIRAPDILKVLSSQ